MKKSSKRWLCIALAFCLAGSIGAWLIQTDFGRVSVKEISFQTGNGTYTGYLFVPSGASDENPAPAVVLSHGYLNNREMQDSNYVELARRGFVVFVQNAYAHGDSSVPSGSGIGVETGGMTEGVEYVAGLPFVDASRIGVSGHSMGGGYTNATAAYYSDLERQALAAGATPEEAKAQNKVAAALIVGNYPYALASSGGPSGENGYLCHLGVAAGKFDEFYRSMSGSPGHELLTSSLTQKLVAAQTGVALAGPAKEGEVYTNGTNGYTLTLYNPTEFHAQNHFSVVTTGHLVEFFERTLGAPHPISSGNQLWWLKEAFNLLGLIGFFAFVVPFADLLMSIPFFNPLRAKACEPILAPAGKDRRRFYLAGTLGGVLNGILIVPLMMVGYLFLLNPFWPQDTTGGIGLWTLGCGLVCLGMLRVASGRKFKGNGEALHTKMSGGAFGRTVLLGLATVCGTYLLVFAADYFLQVDFRIWSFDIRVFDGSKIWVAVKYLPFFLLFYIVNSISISRNDFKEWSETKKIGISVLFNVMAPLLFLLLTYVPVLFTKSTLFGGLEGMAASAGALLPILVIPFVPILGIVAVLSYKLYKLTGKAWLGGFVNALLVTMITVANTSFSFPY